MLEEDRVAAEKVRLQKEAEARAEAAKKAAEEAERKKREMEARRVALCAAWLGTGTTDLPFYTSPPEDDIVIELCGKAPPKPPAASDATSSDDQTPDSAADSPPTDDFSPDHDELAGIKWEIDARAEDDRTIFTLKVTETYQSATFALHVSAEPIGSFGSGGVIAGADRVDLMLGASHEFTVIATGDVEAVEIVLWSMDARAASIRRPTLHLQDESADGAYAGACVSGGKIITVQFVINGQDVRGSFSGDYDEYASYFDLNTHVAVSGATSDSGFAAYDPKAERLTLDMQGQADIAFLEGNDFHDAGDRITGSSFDVGLDGTLNGGVFGGSCTVGDPMGDVWEWSATK